MTLLRPLKLTSSICPADRAGAVVNKKLLKGSTADECCEKKLCSNWKCTLVTHFPWVYHFRFISLSIMLTVTTHCHSQIAAFDLLQVVIRPSGCRRRMKRMQKSRDVAGATRLESGWCFDEMHFRRSQKPKGCRCTTIYTVLQDHRSLPSMIIGRAVTVIAIVLKYMRYRRNRCFANISHMCRAVVVQTSHVSMATLQTGMLYTNLLQQCGLHARIAMDSKHLSRLWVLPVGGLRIFDKQDMCYHAGKRTGCLKANIGRFPCCHMFSMLASAPKNPLKSWRESREAQAHSSSTYIQWVRNACIPWSWPGLSFQQGWLPKGYVFGSAKAKVLQPTVVQRLHLHRWHSKTVTLSRKYQLATRGGMSKVWGHVRTATMEGAKFCFVGWLTHVFFVVILCDWLFLIEERFQQQVVQKGWHQPLPLSWKHWWRMLSSQVLQRAALPKIYRNVSHPKCSTISWTLGLKFGRFMRFFTAFPSKYERKPEDQEKPRPANKGCVAVTSWSWLKSCCSVSFGVL